ncbi:MAG: gamma-glutamyltransferase [Bacteroidia bacterium]
MPFLREYFKNETGELSQFGELWKQTELANTLKEISVHGQDGFCKGADVKEIITFMNENGGIITLETFNDKQP